MTFDTAETKPMLAEVLLKIMKTIYKQIIKTTDSQTIELPKGSEILSLQTQNNDACIWFLCNPKEQEKEVKVLDIFGTGHPITDGYDGKFIGTYQLYDGKLVFHCFERNIG